MDNRGVSAAIGKLLAAGIVVLYLTGSVVVLTGDVVPQAQQAAAEEVAKRVLGDAALRLERAIHPVEGTLRGRIAVPTPATIAGDGYELALRNRSLFLRHPNPRIRHRAGVSIPSGVRTVEGAVDSGADVAIAVSGPADNRTVRLVEID